MKLPHMKYNDSITKQTQVKFGGYNHSLYASEGNIYDMRNISSKHYPLISPRDKRAEVTNIKTVQWRGTGWTWSGATLTIPVTMRIGLSAGDMVNIEGNDVIGGEYIIESVSYDDRTYPEEAEITFYNVDLDIETGEGEISIIKKKTCVDTNTVTEEKEEYLSENTQGEEISYVYENDKLIKTTVTKTLMGTYYLRKKTTDNATYTYGDEVIETYNPTYVNVYDGRFYCDNGDVGDIEAYSKIYVEGIEYGTEYNGFHTVDSLSNKWNLYILDKKNKPSDSTRNYRTVKIYNYGLPEITAVTINEEMNYHTENSSVDEVTTSNHVFSDGVLQSAVRTTISPAEAPSYLIKTVVTVEEIEHEEMTPHSITSIASGDRLYYTTSDGCFYYDNVLCGDGLSDSEKQFAETGEYIYILPDNCYFNKAAKTIESITTVNAHGRNNVVFQISGNGIIFYRATSILEEFSVGDVVSIRIYYINSNDRPVVEGTIESIYYDKSDGMCEIYFTEDIFADIDREDAFKAVISDSMPELKYICAGNNRIWGCDETTIFCTAFGKPLEWFEYSASSEGNDADISFAITPFDGYGEFTGCCFYDNTPMFFKENAVYKVYGSRASGFSLSTDEKPGVLKDCSKTLKVVSDMLFYLSPVGIMRYYGGSQKSLSDEFYEHFTKGSAGEDGQRYYISMTNGEEYRLFVYDIKKGLWSVEDNTKAIDFVKYDNKLYVLNSQNQILCLNPDTNMISPFENVKMISEADFDSEIEFGDYYVNSPNKKGISKLFFRIGVEENSSLTLFVNYDSEREENGERLWREVKTVGANLKRSYILPVIPKRCDHFRIKLVGKGQFVLYSLSFEYYSGSDI